MHPSKAEELSFTSYITQIDQGPVLGGRFEVVGMEVFRAALMFIIITNPGSMYQIQM
jgi:hypothetical protein